MNPPALPVSVEASGKLSELVNRIDALERRCAAIPEPNALTLLVFSGELDKLLAAFVLANGAAASGMRVTMFFTFWGAAALKKRGPQARGKGLVERMFGWLLPGGMERRSLSRFDFLGAGRALMRREMRQKNVPDLAAMLAMARETGVEFYVCEMSMNLMGITREELIEYPGMTYCGVAHFLELASNANTSFFV